MSASQHASTHNPSTLAPITSTPNTVTTVPLPGSPSANASGQSDRNGKSTPHDGLSMLAMATIVSGAVILLLLISAIVFCVVKRRARQMKMPISFYMGTFRQLTGVCAEKENRCLKLSDYTSLLSVISKAQIAYEYTSFQYQRHTLTVVQLRRRISISKRSSDSPFLQPWYRLFRNTDTPRKIFNWRMAATQDRIINLAQKTIGKSRLFVRALPRRFGRQA